jgi:protein transport protein SEC31
MKLSEISRTAVSTWCPLPNYSNYIAAGSIAGSLEDFTAGSKLEIFTIDATSSKHKTIDEENDNKMLLGRVTSADRFNRLAWGKPNNDYELGLIAGALVDGSISLYDASKIVGNSDEYVVILFLFIIKIHCVLTHTFATNEDPPMQLLQI